jgi:predicted CoA-binding protein
MALPPVAPIPAGSRVALINVSIVATDPSRQLFQALIERGNQVFPVRPGVDQIDGHPTYARVQDIPYRLCGAILLVAPRHLDLSIDDCLAASIPTVWIDHDHYPNAPETILHLHRRGIANVEMFSLADAITRRRSQRWIDQITDKLHA